ncbi:MAG: NADAR family protein [Saprospiraceae bacterium]
MKYTIKNLQAEKAQGKKRNYLFFWGHQPARDGSITQSCLSQWWEQSFEIKGITYPTAEHWMMAGKARLFNDQEMWEQILVTKHPHQAKKLGRKVRNFDQKIWEANRYQIVLDGNLAKFEQNEDLKTYLLNTKDSIMVEASPYDKIWGIGLKKDNPKAQYMDTWNGLNLLGFVLMEVRDLL